MRVYLFKDGKYETGTMIATHANVARLTIRTKNIKHKLYMDNFFILLLIYLMCCILRS